MFVGRRHINITLVLNKTNERTNEKNTNEYIKKTFLTKEMQKKIEYIYNKNTVNELNML